MPTLGLADLLPQAAVQRGEGAVPVPGAEVVVDDRPGREVDRQRPPYTAVVVHVADRVDDVAARIDHRAATTTSHRPAGRDVAGQQLPLGVARVRRIPAGTSRGQVLPDRCRGGSCAMTGDKVQRHGWAFRDIRAEVSSPVLVSEGPSPCQPDTPTISKSIVVTATMPQQSSPSTGSKSV